MTQNRRGFLARTLGAVAASAVCAETPAQESEIRINYDETLVPKYTLLDPLKLADGEPVRDAGTWNARRRPELVRLFEREVYGVTPERSLSLGSKRVEQNGDVFSGAGTREQWEIQLTNGTDKTRAPLTIQLLLFLPNKPARSAPAFVGLNFNGNHAVDPDPVIRLNTGWFRNDPAHGYVDNRATEKSRGSEASRWAIKRSIERGYAVATVYYGDFDPDFDDGFKNGLHALYDPPGQADPNRPPDAWGSIAAWAKGLSAIRLFLQDHDRIDPRRIAVMGHSRLGKTALWAGALDERFALVISNNSGCGGAALSKRAFGETVRRINTSFPHWFCDNFQQYNDKEAQLPVDQHELLALIAPRPLLVCSAQEDQWADPKGEYLACVGADPVYRLLGTGGLAAEEMPKLNKRVFGTLMYHIRPGKHDVTDADWELYLDFADKQLASR